MNNNVKIENINLKKENQYISWIVKAKTLAVTFPVAKDTHLKIRNQVE